jgi:hypothetical protein
MPSWRRPKARGRNAHTLRQPPGPRSCCERSKGFTPRLALRRFKNRTTRTPHLNPFGHGMMGCQRPKEVGCVWALAEGGEKK